MAGEFIKSTKIKPAVLGAIANPDDYNQNIGGQSRDSLLGIDADGNFQDFNVGDETNGTIGSLISNLKLRDGALFKIYNAFGVFIKDLTFGQATTSILGSVYLPDPITISNNGADPLKDIDFSAGVFQFDDGTGQVVVTATTKQLDNTWASGSGNGGLFSGVIATDTWYHCFEISNDDGTLTDAGFSTDINASDIPLGYTKKRRVGSILTDATPDILSFNKINQVTMFKLRILDASYAGNIPTAKTNITISCPPVPCLSILDIALQGAFNTGVLFFNENDIDSVPSQIDSTIHTGSGGGNNNNEIQRMTASSTISLRANQVNGTMKVNTVGYIDLTLDI